MKDKVSETKAELIEQEEEQLITRNAATGFSLRARHVSTGFLNATDNVIIKVLKGNYARKILSVHLKTKV